MEYGEYAFEAQLTKAVVVKKLPGANAFFKGETKGALKSKHLLFADGVSISKYVRI